MAPITLIRKILVKNYTSISQNIDGPTTHNTEHVSEIVHYVALYCNIHSYFTLTQCSPGQPNLNKDNS